MLDRQVRWAAEHGFTDRLELLARHGVDVSGVRFRDPHVLPDDPSAKVDGRTPLHEAAWDGDLDRIRALLAAGADATVTDDVHGGTPLDWAEYAYQAEAAALLRQHQPPEAPA
jgi:ankyrin repeat protein